MIAYRRVVIRHAADEADGADAKLSLPCVRRVPSEPHHLAVTKPRALRRRVSERVHRAGLPSPPQRVDQAVGPHVAEGLQQVSRIANNIADHLYLCRTMRCRDP